MSQNKTQKFNSKEISLEMKIEILDRLAKGQGSTSAGKIYEFNEATIRTIKRNETTFRNREITIFGKHGIRASNTLIPETEIPEY